MADGRKIYRVREDLKDAVIELCDGVISATASVWRNPNGAGQTTCPFCGNVERYEVDISDIKHQEPCTYLLAKEILKKIEE